MKLISVSIFARIAKMLLGGGRRLSYRRLLSFSDPRITTQVGFLPVYVGEEKERFEIPTKFLAHPLFKMLLEKACMEYGFEQKNGLALPCTVSVFRDVVTAVKRQQGHFHVGSLVEEYLLK